LPRAEVVVVDNASADDTMATVRGSRAAHVIELEQNVGFGAASNRGVSAAGGTITALLNPDVELLDDSLLALAAEAARLDLGERLLAPRVIGGDGHLQDSVHPPPGSAAELARVIVPFTLLPSRWMRSLAPWRSAAPRRVGWAVGCALVARTATLRALGPFDATMLLYAEDLELGLRASEQGIDTWYWPSARVLHHGAHATRPAFGGEAFDIIARARRDALTRRRGAGAVAVDDTAQTLTFAGRIVVKCLLGRDSRRERQQLRALIAARRDSR
jgi:GT2 family glycosyltransferase